MTAFICCFATSARKRFTDARYDEEESKEELHCTVNYHNNATTVTIATFQTQSVRACSLNNISHHLSSG